jgi:hypothetical protein
MNFGSSSGLPQRQRATGTPSWSTSTAVPAWRIDWNSTARPSTNEWFVTRVSRVSVTGRSLRMKLATSREVGVTPSTRAHSRSLSGRATSERIRSSRSQTRSEPVPPNGPSPSTLTFLVPRWSAGFVKGSGPASVGASKWIV